MVDPLIGDRLEFPRCSDTEGWFRQGEAVELYRRSGKGLQMIAEELGIAHETLRKWSMQHGLDQGWTEGLAAASAMSCAVCGARTAGSSRSAICSSEPRRLLQKPLVTGLSPWRDPDSNRGHHDFQLCALPTERWRGEATHERGKSAGDVAAVRGEWADKLGPRVGPRGGLMRRKPRV